LWKGIPYLWKDKSFQERRIILLLAEYNKTRGFFPFWEFVTIVRQFPTIHATLGHGTFPSQPGKEVFLLSKVELKFRHSTVYSQASFLIDREKAKLLVKQLAKLGIEAAIFSGQPISIQGRKELSKEELRQRYMYPSSIKRVTGLQQSLLTEDKVARQPKPAMKPNLDFLTPAQRERLEQLLAEKSI
jgi:hypothetical protein